MKILELEAELQKAKRLSKEVRLNKMEEAADLYEELGDKEKTLAILKRVLKGKNGKDAGTLNKMGILCGSMGDYERQEKFYLEAARVSPWSGPLFNLALAQKAHGEAEKAGKSLNLAIDREKSAPYYVLRALLAEDANDNKTRDKSLEQAFSNFNPVSVLEEWELYWFRKAAIMAKDDKKLNEIKDEEIKRKRAGKEVPIDDSLLPALKAGSLVEVD